MAILQPIIDIPFICYAHGIRHVVMSPGSRSASLTLAFARHGGFETHVVIDERSAGFIAMGIAQQTNMPVVVICTSGSAAYNLAPAVSEAFFQHIPLLILTADRPKEWTHQHDGQTIYQSELYGKHVKRFFELSSDYQHRDAIWSINRMVNDAINTAGMESFGPVHINVPIREPFYPERDESFVPSDNIRIIKLTKILPVIVTEVWHQLLDEWDSSDRILIVGGQYLKNERLNLALTKITEELDIPVVGDSITNLDGSAQFIRTHDLFLSRINGTELAPDLLITYGLSLISKELKVFLRNNPAIRHWHVGQDLNWTDPLQTVTRHIAVDPAYFFENIFEKIDFQLFTQNSDPDNDSAYLAKWARLEEKSSSTIVEYIENLTVLTDLRAIYEIILVISGTFKVHLGNSMPVRYFNILGKIKSFEGVFCNRGTSGIDGSVSTAVGAAIANGLPTLLIVGDVSFLYDRNGLLSLPLPENLKIIVLNNGGGNIFRMIDGPAKLPELEKYFETRHEFSAKRSAEDSGLAYFAVDKIEFLEATLHEFLSYKGISLLEVFTRPEENLKSWKGLKALASEI